MIVKLANPSEFKYCDNYYLKCEYVKTSGKLYYNKIEKSYSDFNIQYKLLSSYVYNIGELNHTCINLESHIYDTYNEAYDVSNESIGTTKNFYYSNNDFNDCKLHYELYDPRKFAIQYLMFAFFGLGTLLLLCGCILDNYKNNLVIRILFSLIFLSISSKLL